MMRRNTAVKKLLSMLFALMLITLVLQGNAFAKEKFKIAWSHYTGWEPWEYANNAGILKKWADKYGIEISLTLVNDYVESINQYTAGQYDGCVMTNMDALTIPAVGGIDSSAIIIGDYSNGNDGIGTKGEASVAELSGKEVMLVQYSVSHYLLARALDQAGKTEKDLGMKLVNVSDAEIAGLFAANPKAIAVTWNPPLMTIREAGAKIIFDSSKIPGEILDLMVVRTSAPGSLKKALTGAWFETMRIMSGKDKSAKEAVAYMAKFAGNTEPAFLSQLKTTAMYYNAKDAADFARGQSLKKTMEYVRTFTFEHGLFGQNASSKDFVGIEFPDGTVMGSKRNVKLRFTDTFMRMSAEGKL
jgi:NitT/TauT family transport system substrate-binding protein